jgi:hypothetical protein
MTALLKTVEMWLQPVSVTKEQDPASPVQLFLAPVTIQLPFYFILVLQFELTALCLLGSIALPLEP